MAFPERFSVGLLRVFLDVNFLILAILPDLVRRYKRETESPHVSTSIKERDA